MIKWFKGLSPIVQIVIIIIVAFFLWKIYNWIRKQFRTRGQALELGDITSTINQLQQSGLQPSFPTAQYATWANQLVEAFNGCGTSNGVWTNVFTSVKNDLDIALLIEAYGVRTFDECNWEFNFGDFKGTLSEALVHELSGSELSEVNDLLKSKGIKYTF